MKNLLIESEELNNGEKLNKKSILYMDTSFSLLKLVLFLNLINNILSYLNYSKKEDLNYHFQK